MSTSTRLALVAAASVVGVALCLSIGRQVAPPGASQAQAEPADAASLPGTRGSEEQLNALAARPTPHRADGRPDFNATWDHLGGIEFVRVRDAALGENESLCVFGCAPREGDPNRVRASGPPPPMGPGFPDYKPEFLAKVQDLKARQVEIDTNLQCAPPGVPRIGPPSKIMQNAQEVVLLYDDVNGAFFRIIPTDGRPHRTDVEPTYLGDAIGRYEGDALVIETRNLLEDTWLTDDGAFHTADLKVTERLTRVGDTIRYEAVAHDPAVLSKPWALRPLTLWVTADEIVEPARCQDRDLAHMVDGSYHTNPR